MRFAPFFALTLLLPLLSACLGDEDNAPRLQGERIDVLIHKTDLVPSTEAFSAPLNLPAPVNNANWPQTGGTPNHAPAHISLPTNLKRAWSANVGGGAGHTLNPPIVHSGQLFTFNTKGQIVALNAASGNENWRTDLELREEDLQLFTGGLAAAADRLFATTPTGEVLALNTKDGTEIWRIDLAVPIRAAPTFFGGGLFVTSHDNRLFALNGANGKLVWTHSGIEESLSLLGGAAPAAAYGIIAAAYSGGDLYILKGADGEYLWHDAFAGNKAGDPFSGLNAITAPPVLADGIAYAVNVNGRLTAFHLQTGQRLWNVNISAAQMPWVVGFGVFVVTENDELIALNRRDGGVRWLKNLNSSISKSNPTRTWVGPVLAGNRLIVASSDGHVLSFDPTTGEEGTTSDLLRGDGTTVPPVVANNRLYFLTTNGHIVAFE